MRFTVYRAEAPGRRHTFDVAPDAAASAYNLALLAVRHFLDHEDAALRLAFFDDAEVVVEAESGQTWWFQVEAEVSWEVRRK